MESARKCFKLDIQESALCGDAVLGWTWSLSEQNRQGWSYPHYFPRRESPEPIALFPMCVQARFLGESLPMLWKCEEASTEDASRPTARPTTEGTKPQVTITYLQAQSNWYRRRVLDGGQPVSRRKGDRKSMGRRRLRDNAPGRKWPVFVWD